MKMGLIVQEEATTEKITAEFSISLSALINMPEGFLGRVFKDVSFGGGSTAMYCMVCDESSSPEAVWEEEIIIMHNLTFLQNKKCVYAQVFMVDCALPGSYSNDQT